jgi:hypothetical protein
MSCASARISSARMPQKREVCQDGIDIELPGSCWSKFSTDQVEVVEVQLVHALQLCQEGPGRKCVAT